MIQKISTAFFIALLIGVSLKGQNIVKSKYYPTNAFRYPLDLPPSTAGSFGELRPNHFHSGLDFKTNRKTGYPIYAAMDGYISRLRIQFGGFGRAVYITHPNGFTTVYAHMDSFSPEIDRTIRAYQYQQQSYEVDFTLQPFQMPVYKGQQIALSGNAGASGGPHLHFEIRDTETEETINPQLFGLTIPDNVPPTISSIGIYHLNGAPFSEKTQHQFLQVKGASGTYSLVNTQPLKLSGEIGFAINTYDLNNGSVNHNGIYSIELKLDGNTVYTFAVERFSFSQTRAINAHLDYPAFLSSRRWMQKCFILPGNKAGIYPQSVNRGLIRFTDDNLHDIEYIVKDVAGNTSKLSLKVQSTNSGETPVFKPSGILFPYNKYNEYHTDKVKVLIKEGNLYDDLDFQYKLLPKKPNSHSETHRIHNRFTPLHEGFMLWIKPDNSIGNHIQKAVIVNAVGGVSPGVVEDGFVKGQCRFFGDYYLKIDTVPPVITPINIKDGSNLKTAKNIILRMSDNLSGIKNYAGKIDGKWVLVEHDYKSKQLRYYFDANIKAGKHTFELTVSDNKDNVTTYTANFYR